MSYYFNGEKIIPDPGHSIAHKLDGLGVSDAQRTRIIDWDVDLFCCMRFVEEFSEITEDTIDFGTKARLGIEVLIPSEIDPDKGVLNHKWVAFQYCPFCGRSLEARMERGVSE